jgi:hypothetical protein
MAGGCSRLADACSLRLAGDRRGLESRSSAPGPFYGFFSLCQPPARLLAMICLSIAVSAWALIVSPCLKAIVLAVLLLCRPVMMPSGSGMIAPS